MAESEAVLDEALAFARRAENGESYTPASAYEALICLAHGVERLRAVLARTGELGVIVASADDGAPAVFRQPTAADLEKLSPELLKPMIDDAFDRGYCAAVANLLRDQGMPSVARRLLGLIDIDSRADLRKRELDELDVKVLGRCFGGPRGR